MDMDWVDRVLWINIGAHSVLNPGGRMHIIAYGNKWSNYSNPDLCTQVFFRINNGIRPPDELQKR